MRAGLVSYRTSRDGRREFETSELIRAYGELKRNETPERHTAGQAEKTSWSADRTHSPGAERAETMPDADA